MKVKGLEKVSDEKGATQEEAGAFVEALGAPEKASSVCREEAATTSEKLMRDSWGLRRVLRWLRMAFRSCKWS